MDGNYTYCGERLVMYIIIKSLSCIPETNILYIKFISIKKRYTKDKNILQEIKIKINVN